MGTTEKRLAEMGFSLPNVPMDTKHWARCTRTGGLLFIGTTGPWPIISGNVKGKWRGVIGQDLTVDEGKLIAKMSALSVLAVLKNELGDLDKIERILKIEVHMHAVGDEYSQFIPVADAACDLFMDLFGERGRPTRTIVSSTDRSAVQIDAIVSVKG